jgi:ubiquitin-conjugating enzyme E2 J2
MASPLATKRLQRELKALHKSPLQNPKIVAVPNESNILEWHYVLEGPTDDPNSPYKGGIYHGKLIFPREYPYKPPGVIMLTPNGRFKPNRRLCLSMSDFHPESWNPMWSISTILMGLCSFMLDNKPTTGSIETTAATKRKFAGESLEYNVKQDKLFCSLFPEYVELWEKREEQRKAKLAELGLEDTKEDAKKGVLTNTGEVNDIYAFGAGIVAVLSILFAILRFL